MELLGFLDPILDFLWLGTKDLGTVSLILFFGMIILLGIGMPLGFASAFLAVVVLVSRFGVKRLFKPGDEGFFSWFDKFGSGMLKILHERIYGDVVISYVLLSVPLFILMASLLERSGIAKDMFNSLSLWLNRTRGGVAIVTSMMAVVMAAMSGIIGGEVVLLGLIALPQMLRLGYNQNLAIGTICASGSLGTMIPPSIVLIFYGLITNTSVDKLFKGAFLPGFILAACYITYIIIRTKLNPSLAPLPEDTDDDMKPKEKLDYGFVLIALVVGVLCCFLFVRAIFFTTFGAADDDSIRFAGTNVQIGTAVFALISAAFLFFTADRAKISTSWALGKGLVAPLAVVGVVLGSIYMGIASITEAAGMGSLAVLVLIILRGEFSFGLLQQALMRTFKSTGTIIWVTMGATALAGAYTVAGGPTYIANLIAGSELSTTGILLMMMLVFLFMGAFMDWVGIVLLIMPVFVPIVLKLPLDEIGLTGPMVDNPNFLKVWFGILFCVNMQVSFLSPPFGPAAFYLKSVTPPHISLPDIFRSFLPFIAIQIFVLSLVLFFPEITMVPISTVFKWLGIIFALLLVYVVIKTLYFSKEPTRA